MPSWYVHIQAAAETLELLNAGVPAGSPLTAAEATQLHTAGHDHRNYLAAGALGPDLFFLLPDFKGDLGTTLLKLVRFALGAWKLADESFIEPWEKWMTPVLDDAQTLANGISGGMLGEIAEVQTLVGAAMTNVIESLASQTTDLFGFLTSGTQAGFEDSAFFWSDAFHYRRTYEFARRLYRNALMADTADDPERPAKQQAFALGWISHCATDVAGHPFTNAKVGGPYRTHWQRHHVAENHFDGHAYTLRHPDPMACYSSLDTSALHFRLAFTADTDKTKPADVPTPFDWFPASWSYPDYLLGEHQADRDDRKAKFDVNSEPLPEHLCELLRQTMQDVYGAAGPQVLKWDGPDGRPTVQQIQDMFAFAYEYVKYSTSSGLSPRMPSAMAEVITDHDLPHAPGGLDDSMGADPGDMSEFNFFELLFEILSFVIWLGELAVWLVTIVPALINDLLTWPLRELIHELLVVPAWSLYMLSRSTLVMEGFLLPKPEEVSLGLVTLGMSANGPLIQLRGDIGDPRGFAVSPGTTENSGLDTTRGAPLGFSTEAAYPRGVVMDLIPPFLAQAPLDLGITASEFVAPWRYPEHNMAGRRNGWEAPRTHVGPYVQGDDAKVLLNGAMPGSDAARARYEGAATPDQTEAVSAALLATAGANLGDPIDYGAYLMGHLTGTWTDPATYVGRDDGHRLPDFNLDADRGYAYQCWDYVRHAPSKPPAPSTDPASPDVIEPDQWRCAPSVFFDEFSKLAGVANVDQKVRDLYGYQEPCTVPQRYAAADNIHHRSAYDPLKHLQHEYLPHPSGPGSTCDGDLQVSDSEMRDAMMSPTGRTVTG
jgi:hypothetical protein